MNINLIANYFTDFQKSFCQQLEQEENGKTFFADAWNYQNGLGGGISCVMEEGNVFEKAGVNFSHIHGQQLPKMATSKHQDLEGRTFQATGVSIVIHPKNPFIPTSHANVRFFIAEKENADPIWWFGGGFDLTPYYGFEEDCMHWHQMAKAACDPFGETVYPRFKKWCDDYFYLPHRQEPRGIGGLFFDNLNEWGFEKTFEFVKSVAEHYAKAYLPLVAKRKETPYEEKHRAFQAYRRGRYVEFNLLYDRGTLFGLQSQGRTESILMSLPPKTEWRYNWTPAEHTKERELYEKYLIRREWVK